MQYLNALFFPAFFLWKYWVITEQMKWDTTHEKTLQWVKKLSQCLVNFQRLMHTSTTTWSSLLKILGIIVFKKGFNLNLESHDLNKNWQSYDLNKTTDHWDSFLTLYRFHGLALQRLKKLFKNCGSNQQCHVTIFGLVWYVEFDIKPFFVLNHHYETHFCYSACFCCFSSQRWIFRLIDHMLGVVIVDDLISCIIFYLFYLDSIYPCPLVYKGPQFYLESPVNLQVVKTVCWFLLLNISCNTSSSLPVRRYTGGRFSFLFPKLNYVTTHRGQICRSVITSSSVYTPY